jgi:hypothetical protein
LESTSANVRLEAGPSGVAWRWEWDWLRRGFTV